MAENRLSEENISHRKIERPTKDVVKYVFAVDKMDVDKAEIEFPENKENPERQNLRITVEKAEIFNYKLPILVDEKKSKIAKVENFPNKKIKGRTITVELHRLIPNWPKNDDDYEGMKNEKKR